MLTIKQISLVTDAALDSRRAQRLSAEVGDAISTAWRERGERAHLIVDRLVIDAPGRDLAVPEFARTVADTAVRRLLQQRRGS
jgi:hypothetical protein